MTKRYYRIMLGPSGKFAGEGIKNNYIGVNFSIDRDLTTTLPENWRDFNKDMIPVWLKKNPGKSRVAAGLACGQLWTVSRGLDTGDIILTPRGDGVYAVGEVIGGYEYVKGADLPHRRPVKWFSEIKREGMSEPLRYSSGGITTVADLTEKYSSEISDLLEGKEPSRIIVTDDAVEDASVFALEEHLEQFLVKNWKLISLAKNYDIYTEDGEIIGQQFVTDTGRIDILAISKDRKELLIIELKRGRTSEVVVGQTLKYMGYIRDQLAEKGQKVRGLIIGKEKDKGLEQAISMTPDIRFMKYLVNFKLNN